MFGQAIKWQIPSDVPTPIMHGPLYMHGMAILPTGDVLMTVYAARFCWSTGTEERLIKNLPANKRSCERPPIPAVKEVLHLIKLITGNS